ncbi:MAG: Bicarbonate transport ATP-binding protein CmpD [Dehalococcoidia bacterium]|nr:ABC transporter ATP-binding protein [bacterium Unc6]MBT9141216.1 Bicarbonate transport ATP-binding protein CmpD [Bacillota bacterium]
MIEAREITKFFSVINPNGIAEGNTAVLSVSLKIEDGEFVAIVGPTGCGKSTFLEILAGLQAPSEGQVYMQDKMVLEPLPHTRKEMDAYQKKYRFLSPIANNLFRDTPKFDIAMIFQDYSIYPWMTALENVLFTLKLRGVLSGEREQLARRYLSLVGLSGAENRYPSQLSGGMRQRVALARALSVEPKIILMDEPFAAIDALSREKLQDDLLNIWKIMQKTVVFVTHDIEEAVYLADRIIVFSPQPGTVRNIISVDVPRPRMRGNKELVELENRIFQIYRFDVIGEALDYVI